MRFKFSYICFPSFAKQRQTTKFKVELKRHAYQLGSWVVRRFCSSWIRWNTSCRVQPWFALCETWKTSPAHKQLFTEARNRYNGMVVYLRESDYYKTKLEQADTIQLFLKNCWELVRFKISSFVDFLFGLTTYDSLHFLVENFHDYYI